MNKQDEPNSLLGNLDFNPIEELDPSLSEGHKLSYDREVPFELRLESEGVQEVASLESIRVKILTYGDDIKPTQIRIELSCENDLFFHFTSDIDEENFNQMQESQKLCIEFKDLQNLCKKLLNNSINEPQSFIAVFIMQKDGTAKLDFIQNIEYKFIELLTLDFVNSPDDTVRKQIAFRYNALKQKYSMVQDRVNTINNIVKTKNPSLLLQITKTPMKTHNQSIVKNTSSNNFTR